jgi:predicted DNA-binding protein (MmcQ/YjbR family)
MRNPLPQLRRRCLALPEAHEVVAWSEATFRVKNKQFAMFASADNHHGRYAVWLKATHFTQDQLVSTRPDQFFVPPYVGTTGWVGMWLDRDPDWARVDELLQSGYRLVAPKRLVVLLDAQLTTVR